MSGISFSQEKFYGLPIPEDGVSVSSVSASNLNILLKVNNNTLLTGNYSLPTVTITLKGIFEPPIEKPTVDTFGATFSFRGDEYIVTEIIEGIHINIGGQEMITTWSISGVNITKPYIKI